MSPPFQRGLHLCKFDLVIGGWYCRCECRGWLQPAQLNFRVKSSRYFCSMVGLENGSVEGLRCQRGQAKAKWCRVMRLGRVRQSRCIVNSSKQTRPTIFLPAAACPANQCIPATSKRCPFGPASVTCGGAWATSRSRQVGLAVESGSIPLARQRGASASRRLVFACRSVEGKAA